MSGSRFVERAQTPGSTDEPIPVVIVDQPIEVTDQTASTATRSSVAASLVTVTLLAANSARLGATIYNDTLTGLLFLALGAGATTTDFTLRMLPQSYYEVPFDFVGIITGVWSVADGSARITELTP